MELSLSELKKDLDNKGMFWLFEKKLILGNKRNKSWKFRLLETDNKECKVLKVWNKFEIENKRFLVPLPGIEPGPPGWKPRYPNH